MQVDLGARGFHSYEVMDTCRPLPDLEDGDADLSLLSYLDCLENSYVSYTDKVDRVDFQETFDYLIFHTPFAGMVKGAHRKMMRQLKKASPNEINADFIKRVKPSLIYCNEVGNIYSATLYLALCSLIDSEGMDCYKRVGLFSYGSGCSSEFFSGLISNHSKSKLSYFDIKNQLQSRYSLNMEEYDKLIDLNMEWLFGVKNKSVKIAEFKKMYDHFFEGKGLLVLKHVKNFHRKYVWS
jgi:polyketide biosynthesis 3-hydroxy-3-methylglutaryl-CoA synthase-like enzyme PksG